MDKPLKYDLEDRLLEFAVHRVPLVAKPGLLAEILRESDELVRIFSASIRTAESNRAPARQNLSVKRSALSVERLPVPLPRTPAS